MIRPDGATHRSRRSLVALAALVSVLLGPTVTSLPAAASVGEEPPLAPPAQVLPPTKGPGVTSAPEWLPLRRGLDGGELKVGCTHESKGSQFGYACGGHHSYWALDLMADQGTPAYAAGRGFATNGTGTSGASGYGNVVRIDHGDGTESIYAHLSEVLVPAEGAWVDEDTVVGLIGSTGVSSAPHLHFEVRKPAAPGATAEAVDPGPLRACVLATQVEYPAIRGYDSWDGLAWGSFTVFSDGTSCSPAGLATAPATEGPGTGDLLADQLPTGFLVLAMTAAAYPEALVPQP